MLGRHRAAPRAHTQACVPSHKAVVGIQGLAEAGRIEAVRANNRAAILFSQNPGNPVNRQSSLKRIAGGSSIKATFVRFV